MEGKKIKHHSAKALKIRIQENQMMKKDIASPINIKNEL